MAYQKKKGIKIKERIRLQIVAAGHHVDWFSLKPEEIRRGNKILYDALPAVKPSSIRSFKTTILRDIAQERGSAQPGGVTKTLFGDPETAMHGKLEPTDNGSLYCFMLSKSNAENFGNIEILSWSYGRTLPEILNTALSQFYENNKGQY